MDIAALSMAMSQTNVSVSVSTAVLAKSLDQAETIGQAMTEMLETSVDPVRGHSIDVSI